ncbi:sugar phosphate nucleotidyltransferase [Manganibacter manganicus]|uniref:Nucleotidyltransferase n=1 Tax=Manganibacter manganicus TaxID=1873176 RepID=A0A1V8RMQ3_9HYPH|nr:phosphocholine cytidylyltransferase family protein [Pseudaminobacter manganicus]OQM74436.1 nucleotidyltransferase [Pseudaminobacter manganicus]
MKAIILSAGQGRRLLPLTAEMPKCLLQFGDKTLLEWQLDALTAAGIDDIVVVTGFAADKVEVTLERIRKAGGPAVRMLYNPFFALADNLASCWAARHEMQGDFLVLNGDTLMEPEIARRVVAGEPSAAITVTIDRKDGYDADDMKVSLDQDRLLAIGKTLPADSVDGESIGFLRFSPEGGARFVAEIECTLRTDAGLKLWYLSAIDRIARQQGGVGVRSIEGLEWGELDFSEDLERNRAMTARWARNTR